MKLKLRKPIWTEKRDSTRLEMECPVVYQTSKTAWLVMKKMGKPVSALMLKPSVHGLRIYGEFEIPMGTVLKIEVQMKKIGYDRSFLLQGKVMWTEYSGKTKGYEQGISLSNSEADQRKWEKFMMERLREQDNSPKSQTFKDK